MKQYKLGLFSYSYHLTFGKHDVFSPDEKMDIFSFIDRCTELGIDGIQIDICHLEFKDKEYLHKIRDYAKLNNLYIEYGSTGLEDKHTLEQLHIAKELDAELMRTYMGFNRYDRSINPEQEVKKAIEVLESIKPIAEAYGIKIALENHCDATTKELLSIMERVGDKNTGMCVDLGNFLIHGEDPLDSVQKLAPYIINTHFKDYAPKMENWGFKYFGVPLGQGIIDLKAILEVLTKQCGLDKIMLEIPVEQDITEESTLLKENDFIKQSIKYAREVLNIR